MSEIKKLLFATREFLILFTSHPLLSPLSPLFIVVTKPEVFVYNLALSLVLSEQVKQTHCIVTAIFLGITSWAIKRE